MTTITEGLQTLHRILLEIEETEGELARGPKRISAAERKIAEKQAEIDAQKELITSLRKASDEKSLQLKTNEARIVDFKVKLNEAKSNREYNIIKGQMDADAMANSVLEDEILESLEKVDVAIVRQKEMATELEALTARKKDVEGKVAAKQDGLESALAESKAALAEAEKIIPSKYLEQYRRLQVAYGAATLAPIDEGCCSNCNGTISAQVKVQLNTHQVIYCQGCGRIMYNPPEEG